jgi:hypothetical protein
MRLMRSAYCLSVYSFVSVHLSVYPPSILVTMLMRSSCGLCVSRYRWQATDRLCLCSLHFFPMRFGWHGRNEAISSSENFVFKFFSGRLQRIIAQMSPLDSLCMPSCLSILTTRESLPDCTLESFPGTHPCIVIFVTLKHQNRTFYSEDLQTFQEAS